MEEERKMEAFTELLERGNYAIVKNNYHDAEQFYRQAENLEPNDWRAIYALWNVNLYQEKWTEAEEAYRHAFQLNQKYSQIPSALGFVLMQPRNGVVSERNLAEAETHIWRAVEQAPWTESSLNLLDMLLEKRHASVLTREQAYLRALTLYSNSIAIYLRLSKLLRSNGRDDEADKYLEQAEKLVHYSTSAVPVAEVLTSLHRYDEAKRLLQRTNNSYYVDPESLLLMGRILVTTKHYDEAIRVLTAAISSQNMRPGTSGFLAVFIHETFIQQNSALFSKQGI